MPLSRGSPKRCSICKKLFIYDACLQTHIAKAHPKTSLAIFGARERAAEENRDKDVSAREFRATQAKKREERKKRDIARQLRKDKAENEVMRAMKEERTNDIRYEASQETQRIIENDLHVLDNFMEEEKDPLDHQQAWMEAETINIDSLFLTSRIVDSESQCGLLIMKAIGTDLVFIGMCGNIERRVSMLIGAPYRFQVSAFVQTAEMGKYCRQLQRHFRKNRVRGNWFIIKQEIKLSVSMTII